MMKYILLILLVPCGIAAERLKVDEVDMMKFMPEAMMVSSISADPPLVAVWYPREILVRMFYQKGNEDYNKVVDAALREYTMIMIAMGGGLAQPKNKVVELKYVEIKYIDEKSISHNVEIEMDPGEILTQMGEAIINQQKALPYHVYFLKDAKEFTISPYNNGILQVGYNKSISGFITTLNSAFYKPILDAKNRKLHPGWAYNPWTGEKIK